jgi:hypothetical protein
MKDWLFQRSHSALFFLCCAASISLSQRLEAQQPVRPALPSRPNVHVPQPNNVRPAPNRNAAPAPNAPNTGFDNPNFQPVPLGNRGFNDFGYNPWNSWGYNNWNTWNGFSSPYWNSFVNINTVNPAMNGYGAVPNWQAWNNPFLFNAMWNSGVNPMWNNFAVNPWNNFNMNPGYVPFGLNYGMPVGNWNGFNPAMLFPNLGTNQEPPR